MGRSRILYDVMLIVSKVWARGSPSVIFERFFEFVFFRGLGALTKGARQVRGQLVLCRVEPAPQWHVSPCIVVIRSVGVLGLEGGRRVVLQIERLDVGSLRRLAKGVGDLIVLMLDTTTVPRHEAVLTR